MLRETVSCLGVCATLAVGAARPDLVAQVAAGTCREARVSWWGFDAEDATRFLQAAIDSGVPRLIVDKMPTPWFTLPLQGAGNQTLVFEDGAEVCAKRHAFASKGACLLTYAGKSNVVLEGAGTLRMWHQDYMAAPYEKSEWRHALSLLSCSNVVVKGMSFVDSGGDGIYLGVRGPVRKNVDVVIRDVVCKDNHRQGISVISAENLLIENTQLLTTHGTAPQAGIDFEPNHPQEVLKNCVMRNCRAEGNAGAGFTTWAGQLNTTSEPVDLRFENCTSTGDALSFGYAGRFGAEVPARVTLVGCRFAHPTKGMPVRIRENHTSPLVVSVTDSTIVTNGANGPVTVAMDAAWLQENLPLASDPTGFLPHVAPDFAQARPQDAHPGELRPLAPLRLRGRSAYLVYAETARTLHFRGRQIRVGRYDLAQHPLRVLDAAGRLVATVPMLDVKSQAFTCTVPAKGFYRLEVNAGHGAFLLEQADAIVAVDGTADAVNLIGSVGSLWFRVADRVDRFHLLAAGEGVERVTVSLFDPAGTRVWHRADLGNSARTKQVDPAPGLWRLDVARPSSGPFEDSLYSLAGIPAVFFLDPDRIW